MDIALRELEEQLGYTFSNRDLLLEALTHPSFAAEHATTWGHNQRLEFLGDAVLQLIVTRLLFDEHTDWQEGNLSKLRSALCKESSLVLLASRISLGAHLRLGKGEEKSGGAERASNLADTFEAVLGAIYLDGGLEPVEIFLTGQLQDMISRSHELLRNENAKGALQELTQRMCQATPEYVVLSVDGPPHNPSFRVAVRLASRQLAVGEGGTRKTAEKAAAIQALEVLQG